MTFDGSFESDGSRSLYAGIAFPALLSLHKDLAEELVKTESKVREFPPHLLSK